MTWHAPPDTLVRFALEPGTLPDAVASSTEQHLVACDRCRRAVAAAAPHAEVERSWAAIVDVIDRPDPTPVVRVLMRMRVDEAKARVTAATRELQLAWAAAVLLVCGVAVLLSRSAEGPFLALAPLIPLLAVLLAFQPVADPAGEAGIATPTHGLGLALRRVVAVLVPSVAITLVASVAVPSTSGAPVWLAPGLALAAGALALATYVRVSVASAVLAAAWLAPFVLRNLGSDHAAPTEEMAVFSASGQLACVLVALLAAAVAHTRRDRFSTMEVRW